MSPRAARALMLVVGWLVGCEQRPSSTWLLAAEIDAIGVRYGPAAFADDTIPTIVALGADERTPEARVFFVRADGDPVARGSLPGPADRLIVPMHGSGSAVEGAPSLAWAARREDGAWDFTVVPDGYAGARIEGVHDWWWRPGWPDSRVELDLRDSAAWIDLSTAETGWVSPGAAIGVIGRDAAARTLYLEGDRLVGRDAVGAVTVESDAGVARAAWMPGAILFDTAAGLFAWSDPALRPRLLDPEGCLGAIAAPCDAERVLAGACGAHAYARFGAMVWESPCGSGAFVGAAGIDDPPAALGAAVIAVERLDDSRWIVVRGGPGAARGEAWLVEGASARSLGVEVSALDPIVSRDGRTVIVAGEPQSGTASLFEFARDGSLELLAERIREPGTTVWLERWDLASGTGAVVRLDAATGARATIAEGVPAGGYRGSLRSPGSALVISGADASGAGTLSLVDEDDGTVRRVLDTGVTTFVEIAWSPYAGVVYARRGPEAGLHWQAFE